MATDPVRGLSADPARAIDCETESLKAEAG